MTKDLVSVNCFGYKVRNKKTGKCLRRVGSEYRGYRRGRTKEQAIFDKSGHAWVKPSTAIQKAVYAIDTDPTLADVLEIVKVETVYIPQDFSNMMEKVHKIFTIAKALGKNVANELSTRLEQNEGKRYALGFKKLTMKKRIKIRDTLSKTASGAYDIEMVVGKNVLYFDEKKDITLIVLQFVDPKDVVRIFDLEEMASMTAEQFKEKY